MRPASLSVVLLLGFLPAVLLLALLVARPALAGGIVTNCNEAGLDAALAGGGSVTFDCGTNPVTITLTGQKVITAATMLDGGGLVTLDAGGASRVFSVTQGTRLDLLNLTVYNGNAGSDNGGGVYNNSGQLYLTNTHFLSNTANDGGGVYSTGDLLVLGGTFASNLSNRGGGVHTAGGNVTISGTTFLSNTGNFYAGAIWNSSAGLFTVLDSVFVGNDGTFAGALDSEAGSTLVVSNTTFYNNSAGIAAGAILNRGVASLTRVSVYSNTTGQYAGGLYNDGTLSVIDSAVYDNTAARIDFAGGGGLFQQGASALATIANSTFSGNSAESGGGLHIAQGAAVVTNTTFFSNSADSAGTFFGPVAVKNTIVAGGSPNNCDNPLTSLGNNLESADTCGFSATGDITGTNPLLGPLAVDGGVTPTHALLRGSPAIDAGDDAACPVTDQRGVARPVDGDSDGTPHCDIGAYEYPFSTHIRLPVIFRNAP